MGALLLNSDGQTDMTKVIGPLLDYANGLKRMFLARRRRTSLIKRTLKIFGGILIVYGEDYITRVN